MINRKFFVPCVASMLLFLIITSTTTTAASYKDVDHEMLASHYENLAQEMHAKAEEQVELFEHKPSANKFGKNARTIKSHIEYRIQEYEQAASEYLEKADYHHDLAEGRPGF